MAMERQWMLEISRFFGIVVTMYYTDHALPHFHAKYGEHRISVAIEHTRILSGDFPRRAGDLVFEWAALHRDELLTNWELARQRKPLRKIDPLE